MINLMVTDFEKMRQSERYSYVMFSRKDCSYSQALKKQLEVIKSEFPRVDFYEFDVAQNGAEKIRKELLLGPGVPRSLIFQNGDECARFTGFMNLVTLLQLIGHTLDPIIADQPSIIGQAKDLTEFLTRTALAGKIKASPAETKRREKICMACPSMTLNMPTRFTKKLDGQPRCKHCGCTVLDNKGKFAMSRCADPTKNRWKLPES